MGSAFGKRFISRPFLQKLRSTLVGPDLHTIPIQDLHFSIVERSHRHSVTNLRSVVNEIATSRIQDIYYMPKP
jgi:hypothetical protein